MSTLLGQEIINRWSEHTKVSGLNPAARAFAIADLLANTDRRVAVICPNSESAARFHQDVKTILCLMGRDDVAAVFDFYPGWEHSPYRGFNPSIKNRLRRLRALYRIRTGELRGLVTDAVSLAQRCPSIKSLESRSFTLKPGDTIAREELAAKLDLAGYMRNDPVEDPGNYTMRGSLFDVFSSAARRPYRLDFFDDLLETVRSYDPVTQRSDPEPLGEVRIVPVTEWAFTAETIARAKPAIKLVADEFGIPKKHRDSLFESLDAGIRDSSLDYLLPFFLEEPCQWLLDYLDGSWKIALSDLLGVEAAYDDLVAELKTGFQSAMAEGRIVAPWDKLYVTPETFSEALTTKIDLQMDDVLLGVPEEPVADEDAAEETESISGSLRVKLVANTDLKPNETGKVAFDALQNRAKLWAARKFVRVFLAATSSQVERISFLFSQHEIPCRVVEKIDWSDSSLIQIAEGQLSAGFRIPKFKLALVTDAEIFGPKKLRAKSAASKDARPETDLASFIPSLEELNADDLIVHSHHGIGKYRGLVKLEIDRVPQDFLLIEYAGGDKLYLPVYRLDQVQRYMGAPDSIALDKLGSNHFEKTKEKVKGALQELAHQLLQLYAKRASRKGYNYSVPDEAYREFEARFPYAETPDQLRAIEDVLRDMESDKIMDRLVCGDVGYGKTEVAMRAAFRAAMDGKQVAVLVPTTVLALQHEQSFRQRFKDAPLVNIGTLSRFKNAKEIKQVLQGVKEGSVDIVIGTHRLLSKDVAFKDLGLVIVDEEQRFGVEHKERLKALRVNTDVLTLTATPIPRTLHLSLMGMRDISVINTPPVDRLSVRTYVARFDEDVVRRAIQQELARGGQVFFIHNRVQSINAMADRLKQIVPEAKIIVAHGQLDEKQLEQRMLEFYNKEGNVLLCSTIIESGLDIPSANTMIINRADMFGLSQLYQLRGRVGRSQLRAYCYLLLPEEGAVTDDAKKRLEVIQRFVDLGSGFKIASHDLELRGGGDILGKSQTGHIAAVGYELYIDLLDEAIRELRGQPLEDHFDPEIKLPVPALLPESYVPDVHQRLGLYKRLSQASNDAALHDIEVELQDRYGKPTSEVQNLFWLIRIKQLLRRFHIKSLVAGRERISFDGSDGAKLAPQSVLTLVQKNPSLYSITPDSRIVLKRPFQSVQQLFHETEKFLTQVAEQ